MNETPILRQLLICEKTIIEQGTLYISLIGCHTLRRVKELPTLPLSVTAYGLLTNGFGSFTMDIEISSLQTGEEIYHQSFPMDFQDRLLTRNLIIEFEGLTFPDEGVYQIDLSANRESLGATTITVRKGQS